MIKASILAFALLCQVAHAADSTTKWVGTWTTAPQLVETTNNPPSPGLTDNTLRQVVRISIGGDSLRVKFSNDFSTSAVTMKSVSIAVSKGGSTIDAATTKTLTFKDSPSVTMNANSSVFSDPVAFRASPRTDIAITIFFAQTSASVTGHPGSRTTSYILSGDKSNSTDFAGSTKTDHWYVVNTIDVKAPLEAGAVAILGNSITDGRGSTTNLQNRWPDIFSESLQKNAATRNVGVLNLGIGGNWVLSGGGLGPNGTSRYQRDILDQAGVKWVIVFEGVNDLGSGVTSASAAKTKADNLILAYKDMIAKAKAKGMKVYGATIMALGTNYYSQYAESARSQVNNWIRNGGQYDAVIDFDKLTRSASDTTKLGIPSDGNDGIHPTADGYKKMGESIDLDLFVDPMSGVKDSRNPAMDGKAKASTVPTATVKTLGRSVTTEYGAHRIDGTPAR